ncbi:MAG TPA: hypothetical protein VGG03_00665 [Thermoanaerobaculia bacterium]|jgi:hypothetical protein
MPRSSKNPFLNEWYGLLQAVRENESELAGVAPLREALEKAYARTEAFSSLRDTLYTSAQDATQRYHEAVAEGKDASIRLRSYIKGMLGIWTEKLLLYGIRPIRKRGRRARRRAEVVKP